MSYLDIVNLIFKILNLLFSVIAIHFVVFAVIGFFTRKTFPETQDYKRYGVFVSARNEEKVIANLIDSIRKNDYPQDKITVFVIAHNCTDSTAAAARAAGAVVYEYDNPDERTKGYALKYLFRKIDEDYGIASFDGFIGLDADNILAKNYVKKLNDAFVANGCSGVVTSFRNSKNFGTNAMSAMYGVYFMQGCRFESRGRTVTGCSTRVQGTGYVISAEAMKDGWNYVTLTEDWELSADRILLGERIAYCDEAVFYDEQPTGFKIMFRQRLRWSKGHLMVFRTRFAKLLKGLFTSPDKGGAKNKGSVYDFAVNVMPLSIITSVLFLVQAVLTALCPFFGGDIVAVMTDWAWSLLWSLGSFYAGGLLSAVITLIVENKRIKNVSAGLKVLTVFTYPVFLFLTYVISFIALFSRNVGWKPIPHTDTTDSDKLNG